MPLFVDESIGTRMQRRLLQINLNRTDFISLLAIACVLSGLPLASLYFTGKIHSDLCAFGVVLGLSQYFSLRITSYYVVAMARGYLGIIAMYHLFSGLILFILGWVGSAVLGPNAIYVAIVASALAPAIWLRWQAEKFLGIHNVNKISTKILRWLVQFYKAVSVTVISCVFLILIAMNQGEPAYYMYASLINMVLISLLLFSDLSFKRAFQKRMHLIVSFSAGLFRKR
jgi:hypothetical protein